MEEQALKDILSKLTLEEKASLCSGSTFWLTQPIQSQGIPAVWVSDGPHGLRKEKVSGGTNIMGASEPATCFPSAATTSCSWDPSLLEEVGDAIAKEAKALKVSTVLGPGVNIKRSPLCGRNFEYVCEDPFLAGRLGAGIVHGIQKNDVGTSLKHFCCNNEEYIRQTISSEVDERTLREIYLAQFEHIVKTEQPTTVMCSYNRLNGTYLSDNKKMLTDILRDEWGFKGIVVSDWGAVNDRVEGIKAGMDLEMPGNKGLNDNYIIESVKNGTLAEKDLDRVCYRLIKFAFENKAREVDDFKVDFKAHHEIARKAANQSAVLLANDGALPLEKGKNIAVIGQLAKKLRYQGAGSSHIATTEITSFVNALDMANQPYEYADGYTLKGNGYSKAKINQACKVAKDKDMVVVFVGLTDAFESEGFDRSHLNLPDSHNILIEELLKVNKNIVVVLSAGAPVKIKSWSNKVRAILNMYLAGQAGGLATYDILFGDVNPSGKLAETFPLRNHHALVSNYFPMGPRTVEYRESVFVGYRFFDTAERPVQYPFGYGLSYTTFEYSDLKLSSESIKDTDTLTVSFKVKNTGKVAGAEIAQLYVQDVESTIFRPLKELKGFKKVMLNPGEEKEISLELDKRSFAFYNININDWYVESGDFNILVGASSRDIKLEAKVYVKSSDETVAIPDYHKTAPFYYNLKNAEDLIVPDDQFEAILGRKLTDNSKFVKGQLTAVNTLGQINVSPWGNFLYGVVNFGAHIVAKFSENPEMIINSVSDMPLKSTAQMTGGLISKKSLQGLVDMVNGSKGGFKNFVGGFFKSKEEKAKEKAIKEINNENLKNYKD